ncbi:unnamed protein product [Dibothriocephalus latus]|uniref:Uncharacterized protein n=1 Tax=Dibothriocephalus latus TaxID=60516 RepID=A0A3P7LYC0_DIBLA|nr:unnamed protein product [Dibothriocephalus latus]
MPASFDPSRAWVVVASLVFDGLYLTPNGLYRVLAHDRASFPVCPNFHTARVRAVTSIRWTVSQGSYNNERSLVHTAPDLDCLVSYTLISPIDDLNVLYFLQYSVTRSNGSPFGAAFVCLHMRVDSLLLT